MNPVSIYEKERDDIFVSLLEADEYSTFVAMPFGESFSYRSRYIYENIIRASAQKATNDKPVHIKKFASPMRVDDQGQNFNVFTEEIARKILASHFFLADLTNENPGVLVELGVAMGLKPLGHIIVISQGAHADLHADIRNNSVIRYASKDDAGAISKALLAAACDFESKRKNYLLNVSQTISPDAAICLAWYTGKRSKLETKDQSFYDRCSGGIFNGTDDHVLRYNLAIRELLDRRLIWTHWSKQDNDNGYLFGMHATKLGAMFCRAFFKIEFTPTLPNP